ncbi:MAG: sugar phosphate isomerase/epimerase [Ruminococcaceae bacterium]|nr:sugar phosphate isomerase/epimerase [Oscillospiraceae bacterium]
MAKFYISAFADEASEDILLQIEALKRNGLRFIEPRNANGNITKKTDEEIEEIAKTLRDAGITVSSLGSPIGKANIDDPFEEHLEKFRRAISACHILGTKKMRIFSFFVPQDRLEECREEVLRRMRILLDEAEKEGITLCHENESKIYGQNPPEVKDLLTSLPGLRGVFDAANYVMNDQDPIEGIEATLPSIEYMHVKDASYEVKAMTPAGLGDGQYREVIKRVDEACDGVMFLTVEPHLHTFQAFKNIDARDTLKTVMTFENSDVAFDAAVTHLKNILTELGFKEDENKLWTR